MVNISNDYRKAFVEVEAVLNCLNKEDYKKIPINVLEAIEENKDEEYVYKYDESLDYEKWELMPETKALLYNILKDYLANEEQKAYFKEKERFEFMQEEKAKSEKYDVNNIFNKKEDTVNNEENEEENSMVEYKENIFKRLFSKLLQLIVKLHRK